MEICKFELAKKLKEKGFPQSPDCFNYSSYYDWDGLRKIHSLSNASVWFDPNISKDKLIIAISIAPCITCFFAFDSILKVNMLIVTTPNTTSDPSNAKIPFFATKASIKVVTSIIPVKAVSPIADIIDFPICLLFLESFLATGISLFTITPKTIAPNIAGIPTTAVMVKNIDVINKLPISAVNFLAAFVPFLIIFSFCESFVAKGINLSNIFSIL